MASYKNLERIHEIAESLPKLEDARKLLAEFGNEVKVIVHKPKKEEPGRFVQGTSIILPKTEGRENEHFECSQFGN